jgi:hypothetical protein
MSRCGARRAGAVRHGGSAGESRDQRRTHNLAPSGDPPFARSRRRAQAGGLLPRRWPGIAGDDACRFDRRIACDVTRHARHRARRPARHGRLERACL